MYPFDTILVVNSAHGIHCPMMFARWAAELKTVCENHDQWGIGPDDVRILLHGPEHADYWETWDHVVNNARFIDRYGMTWHLDQEDGDVWLVREED